jgi:hypothetical protein
MAVKIDKKLTRIPLLGDWNRPDFELCGILGIDPYDSPRISKDLDLEDHPKSSLRKNEKLITVEMKITQRGSMGGLHESAYMAGINYAIPESLAKVFIKNNWAEPVQKDKPEVKK